MAKYEVEKRGDGLTEKMVAVDRVIKVVKGGRIMAFSALTIVGDGNSRIGMDKGRSKEVSAAVQKVMGQVHCSMIKVPLENGIIHREVIDRHGIIKVFMQPAKEGSGVKTGGPMCLVFDTIGIYSISAKAHGSTSPYSIVCTTLDGLSKLYAPADITTERGLTVEDILGVDHDRAKRD